MGELFIGSSQSATAIWDDSPISRKDTNIRVTKRASDRLELITSPVVHDEDSATLIGVVSAPASLDSQSDNRLMMALVRGDCTALETLYDRYVHRCYGLALKIVQEPVVAEEIVQDVFTKLWSRPQAFSPSRGTFQAWLLAVVRNQGLDKLRNLKSRSVLSLHEYRDSTDTVGKTLVERLPDTAPSPHDQACTNEVAAVVQNALQQLRDTEYQAINLAYFGGLTQQEVANKLNLPLGTVKTRTRSALQHLHQALIAQVALSD